MIRAGKRQSAGINLKRHFAAYRALRLLHVAEVIALVSVFDLSIEIPIGQRPTFTKSECEARRRGECPELKTTLQGERCQKGLATIDQNYLKNKTFDIRLQLRS